MGISRFFKADKNVELYRAAWKGDEAKVWRLLSEGAEPIDSKRGTSILYRPLMKNDH